MLNTLIPLCKLTIEPSLFWSRESFFRGIGCGLLVENQTIIFLVIIVTLNGSTRGIRRTSLHSGCFLCWLWLILILFLLILILTSTLISSSSLLVLLAIFALFLSATTATTPLVLISITFAAIVVIVARLRLLAILDWLTFVKHLIINLCFNHSILRKWWKKILYSCWFYFGVFIS